MRTIVGRTMSHGSRRRPITTRFVGRAEEIARLRAVWDAASGGAAQLVALEGGAGVGKTALIDHWLSGLDAFVIRVNGVEAEPRPPWGVFEDIAARVPGADPVTGLDPQGSAMLIGQWLAGQLQSAGRKIVVVVDDAQWADELSMEAMQ